MDSYTNAALFGVIGIIVALVVTGGLISMVSHEEPSLTQLAAGAVLGGLGGAIGGHSVTGKDVDKLLDVFQSGGAQEMKMGLPMF